MTPDSLRACNEIFAEAYRAAALQEAGMEALAAVVEPIRQRLKDSGDLLEVRAALDTAVGGNQDRQAEEALQKLRTDFAAWQQQAWVTELLAKQQESPEDAWALYLNRYVEAVYHWRTQLAWWWAGQAGGDAAGNPKISFPGKSATIRRLQEAGLYMEHARWPEAYPILCELAADSLVKPRLRAQLWTVCGSIQMYYNTLPDAEHDLAEAEKLFPALPYLTICRADLERVAGRYERSREILQGYLASHPEDPEAHIALGRSYAEEKNWDEALLCYENAMEADPGNSSSYRNKMGIYGKTAELFAQNKDRIAELAALADRADPESRFSNLLEAGYTFQAGGDSDTALAYFRQVADADPGRLEPLTAIGFVFQAGKQYKEATACFEKVRQMAPGAVDGYWNLAALCAEQEEFLQAAAWYEKALPHCPMFARTLWVKAGEMYLTAGDFERAKKACLEALNVDPNFDYALNTLHDLSDKLRNKGYDDQTGMEPALQVLRDIRRVKGEAYEASFQNRTGNVYYYFARYEPAGQHYRNAIGADAGTAVYYDNLAGTLEKLSDQAPSEALLADAAEAAHAAARLDSSNEGYRQQTLRLDRKLLSFRHFGVLPEERSADLFAIRVRFRNELQPWLVKEGELRAELLQKIEALRERFKKAFGVSLPGVRFSADWNIVEAANFVIDLDGIPMQQGWLDFVDEESVEAPLQTLMELLEQNIQLHLADFIHYDSPEISAKFIGKSAVHASGFFQVVRMLLKQKISVVRIDRIHEIYEAGVSAGKTIQDIARDIRCHPDIRLDLPVNSVMERAVRSLTPEQEAGILASTGRSLAGQQLWQIRPYDPVFNGILDFLPKEDFSINGKGYFVSVGNPEVATLLSDLSPGTFFGREEILYPPENEERN